MKDRKHIPYMILASLILALIMPIFNTAGLYAGFSHLPDPWRWVSSYLLAVSMEFSVFITIYSGHRRAGAWFAVLGFFVGLLFHDYWDRNSLSPFYMDKQFMSSTLLQLINSILVWFLSELYVSKIGMKDLMEREQELITKDQELSKRVSVLSTRVADIQQRINQREQQEAELEQRILDKEQVSVELEQKINTLRKRHAGVLGRIGS